MKPRCQAQAIRARNCWNSSAIRCSILPRKLSACQKRKDRQQKKGWKSCHILQPCLGSESTCNTLDVLHDAVLALQLTFFSVKCKVCCRTSCTGCKRFSTSRIDRHHMERSKPWRAVKRHVPCV